MAKAEYSYILESQEESDRLDRQSRMKAFDFKVELQYLEVLEGQRILDAGCGSGIVSSYLSMRAPAVNVVGWDFSKSRIEAAEARYGSAKNIHFEQKNLLDTASSAVEAGRFDTAVCRFVLRHFSDADGRKVIQNIFAALKPGGTLCCIDVEGVLSDVFPSSSFLNRCLRRWRWTKTMNFGVARKMPSLLVEQGFQNVEWHVLTCEFKGEELFQEVDNLRRSFEHAEEFGKKILGGARNFARFRKEYFSALGAPECVHFYNKVIAIGTKPRAKPRLVNGA